MSPREAKVMTAWIGADRDFGFYSFKGTAAHSGVELKHIRRTVRALARAGYLEFCRGLRSEDGEPGGAGYGLTDKGREYLDGVEKLREKKDGA